ncbi:hypothetical protein B0H10DRAFT_2285901 [Mycena sp. CBHHK59/15]|nr:hypothetical protein B0H10DRAFT_2285901 [Mycena sp. CBHHK59/15]
MPGLRITSGLEKFGFKVNCGYHPLKKIGPACLSFSSLTNCAPSLFGSPASQQQQSGNSWLFPGEQQSFGMLLHGFPVRDATTRTGPLILGTLMCSSEPHGGSAEHAGDVHSDEDGPERVAFTTMKHESATACALRAPFVRVRAGTVSACTRDEQRAVTNASSTTTQVAFIQCARAGGNCCSQCKGIHVSFFFIRLRFWTQ